MDSPQAIFGTDGIRGHVGEWPITSDFLLKLGWAVGHVLAREPNAKILIGKDTRISGYMIESALEAGISSAGVNIYLLGPLPTSAIAYLTRTFRAQLGIVISASHNPYNDNGIKFFSIDGYKISDEFEKKIEDALHFPLTTGDSKQLGKAWRVDDAQGRYIEFCKSSIPHNTHLNGLKIVVDCANGSTYHIAPHVLRELGANVISIYDTPDGFNINENCGSTHPHMIQSHVLAEKADLGIAFDGDGDRVIMVDHKGEILDGDEILYIIVRGLQKSKHLQNGGVVGTVMSNMGLEMGIKKLNLEFLRVPVGDHFVLEKLIHKKWIIGGEPSGHIIYLPVTTSADGIITALQVLYAMQYQAMSLYDVKKELKKFPQKTMNILHNGNKTILENKSVRQVINDAEKKLNQQGRVLVRYSGTEPIIRVMVEGENEQLVNLLSDDIASVIRQEINF
jgi:phosphoglucosamine mutase